MTRSAITAVTLTAGGYNLTDATGFTAMATGTANGVSFAYNSNDLVVMKNGTGTAATYTLKVPSPTDYSDRVTIPDETVSVANGKTYLYKLSPIFKQSDGDVYIDCDQTASILVLREPTT